MIYDLFIKRVRHHPQVHVFKEGIFNIINIFQRHLTFKLNDINKY